jgi:hypothetical protein
MKFSTMPFLRLVCETDFGMLNLLCDGSILDPHVAPVGSNQRHREGTYSGRVRSTSIDRPSID